MNRAIMLAAMHSGAGKTSITLGLIRLLKRNNINIRAYKTGPDYIDTAYHSLISGFPCINLEPYFLETDNGSGLLEQYEKYNDKDIAIVEAAMGYYNGIYGQEPRASAYSVANAINAKVCLVVDEFDIEKIYEYIHIYDSLNENKIEAIILNKCSQDIYRNIKKNIEEKCNIKILGFIEENQDLEIPSRHLGLFMPENLELENIADSIADILEKQVDMEFFFKEIKDTFIDKEVKAVSEVKDKFQNHKLRLALAKDSAFCFMYEDNLNLLKENGFEIVEFSPLEDKELPNDIDALWLCGGYPEVYAKDLEKNMSIRKDILSKVNSGLPTIAECGGFMYMHKNLEDVNKNKYSMLGYFDFDSFKTDKLQRFGYIEVKALKENILLKKGEKFKSHEFHHWDSEDSGSDFIATKANKSKEWECIHANERIFAGYPHIYLRANMNMIKNLKDTCLKYRAERETYV